MIAYLKGELYSKSSSELIINCSGVGYLVFTSMNTFEKLPEIRQIVELNTLLIPREDAMQLYGFIEKGELDMFKLLISINGVGPKSALGILSSISPEVFRDYIVTNNLRQLQKLPGIGKKTAERLILELKDKIEKLKIDSTLGSTVNIYTEEALSALIALGYNRALAEKAVRLAENELKDKPSTTIEELIKIALKFAMK
jgi:holliday junction DNA helicase RuvA